LRSTWLQQPQAIVTYVRIVERVNDMLIASAVQEVAVCCLGPLLLPGSMMVAQFQTTCHDNALSY
jgi:hypothetical protein